MTPTSTNLHFHGLSVPSACHQDEVLKTSIQPADAPFEYRFRIPDNEPPGLYWYHPHIHGFSSQQVLGGASGALIVEGLERANPEIVGLPERVLVIRDQDLVNPDTAASATQPAAQALIDRDADAANTGTGAGKPAKDLSVNFVPVPYPDYPLASIAMKPAERQLWRVLNASSATYLNLAALYVPAAANTVGKTIGDQLVRYGLSWKTYQESLPVSGADGVDNSNGTATDKTTYNASAPLSPTNLPPLTPAGLVAAYAVKHNPFAYFQSVQEGWSPENSVRNMVGFDGAHGLYTDLATGHVPSLSWIVPNQCDDQHGRGNGDAFCQFDQGTAAFQGLTDGTQVGLNPGLSEQADVTLNKLVTSIKASPAWHDGRNAIVIVWDENDYSGLASALPANTAFPAQNQNAVVLTVETSSRDDRDRAGVKSQTFYTSFSLLKSMEAGFRLPCLNHACDSGVKVMSDLFGEER